MKEVDPPNNSLDRCEPEVSIDSDCACIVCKSVMKRIVFRPLRICTSCLSGLSDEIARMQSTEVVMSFDPIEHSQN